MKNIFRALFVVCALLAMANIAHAFYDAVLGRFLTRDPIEERGGTNLYAYVLNNPINATDPLGLKVVYGGPRSEFASTTQQIGFLRQNSPTFSAAYQTVVNSPGTYVISPVKYGTGGDILGGNTISWGTNTNTTLSNGTTIYPAYNFAHEIGHAYDFSASLTLQGKGYTGDYTGLAPNDVEAFAWNFSNTVSQEVKANSGLDIGYTNNYWEAELDQYATVNKGPNYPGGLSSYCKGKK